MCGGRSQRVLRGHGENSITIVYMRTAQDFYYCGGYDAFCQGLLTRARQGGGVRSGVLLGNNASGRLLGVQACLL